MLNDITVSSVAEAVTLAAVAANKAAPSAIVAATEGERRISFMVIMDLKPHCARDSGARHARPVERQGDDKAGG
jgi:hypothetical protein